MLPETKYPVGPANTTLLNRNVECRGSGVVINLLDIQDSFPLPKRVKEISYQLN